MRFRAAYDELVRDPRKAVLINQRRQRYRLQPIADLPQGDVDLLPISRHPISIDQERIFQKVRKIRRLPYTRGVRAFEVSIDRVIAAQEKLDDRASQEKIERQLSELLKHGDVLLTRSPTFESKIGLLHTKFTRITFHLGSRLAARLVQDYGLLGIEGLSALFHVYPQDGKEYPWDFSQEPANFVAGGSTLL